MTIDSLTSYDTCLYPIEYNRSQCQTDNQHSASRIMNIGCKKIIFLAEYDLRHFLSLSRSDVLTASSRVLSSRTWEKKALSSPLNACVGGSIPFYLSVRCKAQLCLGHVHFPALDVTYMYLHRELIGSVKYHFEF